MPNKVEFKRHPILVRWDKESDLQEAGEVLIDEEKWENGTWQGLPVEIVLNNISYFPQL